MKTLVKRYNVRNVAPNEYMYVDVHLNVNKLVQQFIVILLVQSKKLCLFFKLIIIIAGFISCVRTEISQYHRERKKEMNRTLTKACLCEPSVDCLLLLYKSQWYSEW